METQVANSVTHAETFVNAGETTTFSLNPKNMSFSHSFTKGLKKLNITAFPKFSVTFDALGGTAVSSVNVVSGGKIGNLPAPTKLKP